MEVPSVKLTVGFGGSVPGSSSLHDATPAQMSKASRIFFIIIRFYGAVPAVTPGLKIDLSGVSKKIRAPNLRLAKTLISKRRQVKIVNVNRNIKKISRNRRSYRGCPAYKT